MHPDNTTVLLIDLKNTVIHKRNRHILSLPLHHIAMHVHMDVRNHETQGIACGSSRDLHVYDIHLFALEPGLEEDIRKIKLTKEDHDAVCFGLQYYFQTEAGKGTYSYMFLEERPGDKGGRWQIKRQ